MTRSPSAICSVGRGPRRRLAAHRLLPKLKTLARRQARAERSRRVDLVGSAGPVHRAHDFAAEEDQAIARRARDRNGEEAGGAIAERFARRIDLGDLGAGADPARRGAVDEGDEILHLALRSGVWPDSVISSSDQTAMPSHSIILR